MLGSGPCTRRRWASGLPSATFEQEGSSRNNRDTTPGGLTWASLPWQPPRVVEPAVPSAFARGLHLLWREAGAVLETAVAESFDSSDTFTTSAGLASRILVTSIRGALICSLNHARSDLSQTQRRSASSSSHSFTQSCLLVHTFFGA